MKLTEQLDFDNEDRKDIYDYVESRGRVRIDDVRQALHLDARGLRHHLAILKRDGYLVEDGKHLEVAYEEGTEETHRGEDVDFVIRPAHQEDVTGLIGVMRQVAEDGTYIEAESIADMIDHENVLLRHNEVESRMIFVATVDKDAVGWVHLEIPEQEKLHHTAKLTVGVLEDYRDNDIGSHLLERGIEWAADHSAEKIYQSLPASNEAAIAFLEGHDWETEAVRENHYKIDGEYVDEVMMARVL